MLVSRTAVSLNLLIDKCSSEEISSLLAAVPRRPLLPPLGAAAWNEVRSNPIAQSLLNPLRQRAEHEIAEPLPVLTDELYAFFHKTGSRHEFESLYFERRRRLARAAISVLTCPEGDPLQEKLIDSFIRKAADIVAEVSWAFPAHVSDPTGKNPKRIDLFCAETANLMAELLDLFPATLPADLQLRIRTRLEKDVFANYLENHENLGWTTISNNWNAVCHQGVLGAALSQVTDPSVLAEILMRARQHLPNFLGGFGPDGGCSEGVMYWSYGFGWFAVLNEQLETRSAGQLSLFEGDKQIREIALFGPRMALPGGYQVNFADCQPRGRLRPSLLSYLGERLAEESIRQMALEEYRYLAETGIPLDSQRTDLFYLVRLLLRCPRELPAASETSPSSIFLPDLSVIVVQATDRRGNRWDFAAKAGHNDEHHNHNDCGSYLLNINETPFICEIGQPEYVRDFFSHKRYEFLAARSLGHSVPLINGCEQGTGGSFAARVLGHSLKEDSAEFQLEAAACYPPEARCQRYVRTFHLDKREGRLRVQDEFALSATRSLETAIITTGAVSLEGNRAVIESGGQRLAILPDPGTRIAEVQTHGYRSHFCEDKEVRRIVLKPEVLGPQITLGFCAGIQQPH